MRSSFAITGGVSAKGVSIVPTDASTSVLRQIQALHVQWKLTLLRDALPHRGPLALR